MIIALLKSYLIWITLLFNLIYFVIQFELLYKTNCFTLRGYVFSLKEENFCYLGHNIYCVRKQFFLRIFVVFLFGSYK